MEASSVELRVGLPNRKLTVLVDKGLCFMTDFAVTTVGLIWKQKETHWSHIVNSMGGSRFLYP